MQVDSLSRRSFCVNKKLLLSSQILVHFDPNLELQLGCDASAYGLGVVLLHKMPDGSEKLQYLVLSLAL